MEDTLIQSDGRQWRTRNRALIDLSESILFVLPSPLLVIGPKSSKIWMSSEFYVRHVHFYQEKDSWNFM